jgi:hypothetical protein
MGDGFDWLKIASIFNYSKKERDGQSCHQDKFVAYFGQVRVIGTQGNSLGIEEFP